MTNSAPLHPSIVWAQRTNLILLTINVEDIKNPVLKFEDDRVYFKGTRSSDKSCFEADMTLYGEINREKSRQSLSDRQIELVLTKKEEGPYWPRLLKDSAKRHWIKVDFNKWKPDEDSDDEQGAGDSMDMDAMMRQMGGLSGLDGGEKPDMGDLEDMDDSDDEDLPDLE